MRRATPEDLPAFLGLARATGLFGEDEIESFAAMAGPVLSGEAGPDQRIWVVDGAGGADAAAYAGLEPMSGMVWNLYFIGVPPDRQGEGAGSRLIAAIASELATAGGRMMIVDTMGTAEFAPQRAFYAGHGFAQEAVIRDYYGDGADKVTFSRRL